MKKCITIHLVLGNIRPRIWYRKMQILWSFQESSPWTSTRTLPWNCWGLVALASTQMYCAMTDGHCMLCLRHDTRPRPKGKICMTGGPPLIGLPPQQLHSRHATGTDSHQVHKPYQTLQIMTSSRLQKEGLSDSTSVV